MTSRETTRLLALPDEAATFPRSSWSDLTHRIVFGAIGWPWLLFSLWGGTRRSKRRLLGRVGLDENSLPNLGSWKADTGFLHRIVDAVEELRPQVVVELGAGASTLVCAKALEGNGGGQLHSFDQHREFVDAVAHWIAEEGAQADLHWAPLVESAGGWPGRWYSRRDIPASIDLLIIDGPPWAIHPFVRGAAECLFDRLSVGGRVLLDDANRPGERIVARRWRRNWPDMRFSRVGGSTSGTLIGHKLAATSRPKTFSGAP
jgi:predicted O-methyltransferase YrrM